MKKTLTIILLIISCQLFAQHYWVDNTGTGDTLATLAEVNALTLGADDTVSFKKGCTWRDQLTVPTSGTAGHYCVFNSYGTGADPRILGSNTTTWANYSGNVWKSASTFTDPNDVWYGLDIWFEKLDGTVEWGIRKAAVINLAAEYDYTWVSNYLYVYAATDPDTRYTSVEGGQRLACIHINDKNYIEINGIDQHYAGIGTRGESYPAGHTGLIVRNCDMSYFGAQVGPIITEAEGYATWVVYNNSLFEYDTIHDCGRRGISLYNYGDVNISNIVIQYCEFYNGFHTTGVDIGSGGSGDSGDYDSIIVRNCYFHDDSIKSSDYSELCYVDAKPAQGSYITGVYYYNNIFEFPNMAAIHLVDIGESYIYHNTFYGHNYINSSNVFFLNYGYRTTGSSNAYIKNNIFFSYLTYDPNSRGVCIYVSDNQPNSGIHPDYNIYWRPSGRIVETWTNSKYYHMDDLALLRSELGWEAHGQFVDANFINTKTPTETDSLMIDALSPAKDAGIAVGINTDYRDSIRDASPDIGAYEQGAISGDPPDPPDLPTVTTTTPVAKNSRATTGGGNVTDDGGGTVSARGVAWSVNPNPSVTDSIKASGTGTGAFTAWIGLTHPGVTYHARGYATNETGTAYGSDVQFTAPNSVYSDSLSVGGIYIDSTFVRNDSLIFRGVDGKLFKIVKYIP